MIASKQLRRDPQEKELRCPIWAILLTAWNIPRNWVLQPRNAFSDYSSGCPHSDLRWDSEPQLYKLSPCSDTMMIIQEWWLKLLSGSETCLVAIVSNHKHNAQWVISNMPVSPLPITYLAIATPYPFLSLEEGNYLKQLPSNSLDT